MANMKTKDSDRSIGICLGASTLSLVELSKENEKVKIDNIIVKEHEGDPRYLNKQVRLIIFSRDIIHKKHNKDCLLTTNLFPGYIFIHKEIIRTLYILRSILHNEFIKPIMFGNNLAKVSAQEMKLLLLNSTLDGKFQLSYAFKKGDKIKIIKGPLKNMQCKIFFINKKKKKAKVSVELFNRKMEVTLGLDFIDRNKNSKTGK